MKLLNYFYKMYLKKLPAFCRQPCPTYKIKTNDRTNKLHFTVKYKSDVLKNSLIRQACTIWNEAESQIPLSTKMSSNTLKRYTKKFFMRKFEKKTKAWQLRVLCACMISNLIKCNLTYVYICTFLSYFCTLPIVLVYILTLGNSVFLFLYMP